MSKRTFIVFGLLILVLAVVIPWLAFRSKGDGETGDQKVASNLKGGQSLFQTNCGTCHALYSAGNKVQGVSFPESSQAPTNYPIATLKNAPAADLANQFVAVVTGEQGQKILEQAGFAQP